MINLHYAKKENFVETEWCFFFTWKKRHENK